MKKKRKLNLRKSKVANMNILHSIKGGMTLGCATDHTCPTAVADTCITNEGITTCPTTYTTSPDTETCPGSISGSVSDGGNLTDGCTGFASLGC